VPEDGVDDGATLVTSGAEDSEELAHDEGLFELEMGGCICGKCEID
jgi:hypothetical protein